MNSPEPPRFASWLLQRFAVGARHESLIGDIVEQYHGGRSAMWYRRQVLAAIRIGSTAFVWAHPRRVLRACVLVATALWFIAAAISLLIFTSGQGWLATSIDMAVFAYCSAGLAGLLLTITCLDEPLSLSLIEPARP